MVNIRPVPMTYAGVRFRSTLEADWAALLDSLGITWQYEPEAVRLPSGELYRPDFYLPQIATWLEIKGPHDERIGKTRELAAAVFHDPGCPAPPDMTLNGRPCCEGEHQLVVVGLAPVQGKVAWRVLDQLAGDENSGQLAQCTHCGQWWWCGTGAYGCRAHRRHGYGDEDLGGSASLPFGPGMARRSEARGYARAAAAIAADSLHPCGCDCGCREPVGHDHYESEDGLCWSCYHGRCRE